MGSDTINIKNTNYLKENILVTKCIINYNRNYLYILIFISYIYKQQIIKLFKID